MVSVIICEKNNAAQRVAAILSKGNYQKTYVNKVPVLRFPINGIEYAVIGMKGHILNFDYPKEFKNWNMDDLKDMVQTPPIKSPMAGWIITALKNLAKEADTVIVATDFDREGELIGAEAVGVMDLASGVTIRRARFSALTAAEVQRAFNNLIELDNNLATAAETRQIIDLAWGAVLTRFMSTATGKMGADFLSVGRVQSPTLALVVDREKEIEAFEPKPFWEILVDLEKTRHFFAKHAHGVFWEKDEADKVFATVKDAEIAKVKEYNSEEKKEYPPAPFNTTQFLAEASRMGISAARAMAVAERLYNDGLISYPRTDNTVYPSSLPLRTILQELKKSEFKKEAEKILAQKKMSPSRGKKETTDHPPIHPVGAATKAKLSGDDWRIYELVVRRFLATLAPPADVISSNATFDVNGEDFNANGYKVIDQGWYAYYPYFSPREIFLPELKKGEEVNIVGVRGREGKTEPPKRFTQGHLIREMENLGLGTKSTRHEIVQKLYDRGYVQGTDITPTTTGRAVIQALEDNADMVSKPDMTRMLEDDMTEIEKGKKNQEDVVNESQGMLAQSLDVLMEHRDNIKREVNEALREQMRLVECPDCDGDLVIRKSKRGKRFVGCTSYPDCERTYPLPQYGNIVLHEKRCTDCEGPQIKLIAKRRRPEVMCLDISCEANVRRKKSRKK
ncbi:MAG: hypothetical protein AYK23_01585 [Candidatus Proteinoplasmatales archaeon SG8-5]|nr:MAG: hypothetical protein AYK23_01585 [Candidatus Proteinoplasmatales archaeon SG8-5]